MRGLMMAANMEEPMEAFFFFLVLNPVIPAFALLFADAVGLLDLG